MDISTIIAAIFFFLAIAFTLKTIAVIRVEDWAILNTGLVGSSACWTMTALFGGWLG